MKRRLLGPAGLVLVLAWSACSGMPAEPRSSGLPETGEADPVWSAAVEGLQGAPLEPGVLRIVLQVGDTPPGGGGLTVDRLRSPFTNGVGQPGFTGSLAVEGQFELDEFVWFDGAIVWRNSQGSDLLNGAESTMGIGDQGQFVYSALLDEDDVIWSHHGLVIQEGTQAPGLPEGTLNVLNDRPTMLPDGRVFWISAFDDRGGNRVRGQLLYTSATGTPDDIEVVLRSDDVIEGLPIARPRGVRFDYQVSDSGEHHIHVLFMDEGKRQTLETIYVDGSLVVREGDQTPDGDRFDRFGLVAINDRGDYFFSAETDAGTSENDVLVYNGDVVLREGGRLAGIDITPFAVVRAVSINNLGQGLHAWSLSGFGKQVVFFTCDASRLELSVPVLSTQEKSLLDSGEGVHVVDFLVGNGPALWLAEDGRFFAEVSLDRGLGEEVESIVEVGLPACDGEASPAG